MPIDYSKWKDIEVSDDEDDTHPNIDTPSLFRWRHQARLERMAEKKQNKEMVEKGKQETNAKMVELNAKLADATISAEEKRNAQKEIKEIEKQEEAYRQKEKELEEAEKLEKWNVDTIGEVTVNKSRINKIGEKKPEPTPVTDEEDGKRMYKFFEDNESLLKEFIFIENLDRTEEYMLEHPHLGSDYAVNWITIEALNLAVMEPEREEELEKMARQNIVLQYLIELAKSLKAIPSNVNVIKAFFKKFKSADPQYMKMYEDEVAAFLNRLRIRAKQKREAAQREIEEEEREERIKASPGGLDPNEVFEALPAEMRAAFESREVGRLQTVAETMDAEVFSYHLKRCIDSGLWVPGPSDDAEEEGGEENDDDEHYAEAGPSNA